MGEVPAGGISQSSCTLPDPTARPPFDVRCPFSYAYRQSGVTMNGTASWPSEGQSGSFTMTCDFDISVSGSATVSVDAAGQAGDPAFTFDGSGRQPCSWALTFPKGTISGTLDGNETMGLKDASTGYFRGEFSVSVVSGSGDYERATGSGTFVQYEEFAFAGKTPPGGMPTIPTGGEPPHPLRQLQRAAPAEGSRFELTLRTGAARVVFVVPPHVTATGSYALHLVTAPGARCSASATQGKKKTSLGTATAGKTGSAVFPGKLGAKLKSGSWKVTAVCTAGGKKPKASTTIRVSS
ncbi:MAG TPA: hypothetical protein VFJ91_09065 [Gaiellaceae bacterium]|nr:hypothetical protein [Gaiellaceae bacterium]